MKETFGNSGGEGGFIFLHKNGNSGEVGGLSWNSLRGGGMDIFWNYTIDQKRVRVFHQGFQTPKKNESTTPKAECFYCFEVFGTPDEKRSTSF